MTKHQTPHNKKVAIRLVSCADGMPSDMDGTYVVEYDPARSGVSPSGLPIQAHLIVTPDISKALFLPFDEATTLYLKEHGTRIDGRPNRPMTAFNVEFVNAPG